jgi:hypothetical protein
MAKITNCAVAKVLFVAGLSFATAAREEGDEASKLRGSGVSLVNSEIRHDL